MQGLNNLANPANKGRAENNVNQNPINRLANIRDPRDPNYVVYGPENNRGGNLDVPNRYNGNWFNQRGNHTAVKRPTDSHNDPRGKQNTNRSHINSKYPRPNQFDKQQPPRYQNRFNDRSRQSHNLQNNTCYFNFTRLHELSKKESDDVVTILSNRKSDFEELLMNKLVAPDFLFLTLQILTNTCKANFTEIVTSVLSHACSFKFLKSIMDYLLKLPFEDEIEKAKNKFYHQDRDKFWNNLMEFFKKIIELLPTKARDELATILNKVEPIIKTIEINQNYKINENIKSTISNLTIDIDEQIKKLEEKYKKKKSTPEEFDIEEDPPENFRELKVIPTVEDLYNPKPFIRRCKVKDAYNSVEHYLDVQFRLLREDFISPLRSGIEEYLNKDQKRRNNDLRVYKKVKLIAPEISKNNVGIIVKFGEIKSIDWNCSKRFMYGGLLLLSDDTFQTILFATVSNRDEKELAQGNILIEPCEGTIITREMYDSDFVMLESKIYFEPYLAVLTAMQHMNEKNFPMENYLVYAETHSQLPKYLAGHQMLKYGNFNLYTNENLPWPTCRELELDNSQYEAFRCALTQEFSVIQGPPGCGKTFIALKIISTLLENKAYWNHRGPIVIVCLTNHALDQFLEGILKCTKSIVRIGSRSKSDVLKPYTLMERRKLVRAPKNNDAHKAMYETKHELEEILSSIQKARLFIKYLTTSDSIVPLACLTQYCFDVEFLNIKSNEELINWLLGANMVLLPQNDTPRMKLQEELKDDPRKSVDRFEDDQFMDDDLELNYDITVHENTRPIFPLVSIDSQIEKCERQIDEASRLRFAEALTEETREKLSVRVNELEEQINTLRKQRRSLQRKFDKHPILNPQRYPVTNNRWKLYWKWVKISYEETMKKIAELEINYRQTRLKLNDVKQLVDLATIREHNIVGLTTTGAAKLHASLRALHAPIVLVEEAAEILEAHVVCSITKACEHVILIGDHKQLRPKASVYELGTKYNLNISLFERMVNIRGNCAQLEHQHRMRPQIAKLITPSIYHTLYNHESVLQYPNVKSLEKNLFFLNHENRETSHNNEESWVNEHEVQFLIAFARHLLMQGYKPTEITILCTYTGQLFAFMKISARYPSLKQLRITTIDNYQGEENRIILLSLVRNNGEGKIGFLKEENRVCVALSRAREGLYIMGNMEDLVVKNEIWPKIRSVLEEEGAIGDTLELRCQIHSEQLVKIKKPNDFQQCPEGGCLKKCNADLSCGHACLSVCHIQDREHKEYQCKQPCNKNCPFDHPCPFKCFQGCAPCRVVVERKLECGHTVKMQCWNDPATFKCYIMVEARLPDCQHDIMKQCHELIEDCKCSHPCEYRLPCGHTCSSKCHVTNDPDHIQYKCKRLCAKNNVGCVNNHPCKMLCYEECKACPIPVEKKRSCGHVYKNIKCSIDPEEQKCLRPCKRKLDCGHPCKLECSDTCGKCQVLVEKKSTCGHNIKVKCCEEATASKCNNKCQKILSCGHPCMAKCKQACTIVCMVKVQLSKKGLCGHKLQVPCYLQKTDTKSTKLLEFCEEPCTTQLACGHWCKGDCGKCKQGRIHVPCSEPCNSILVCGHECKIPCRNECQPCNRPCELRCLHNKCNMKCGMPCTPCAESCDWGCEHRKCSKRCSELCDIEPCNEPCKKLLKCKHPCVGFCGDPCPPLCRICNKEELTEIFFGEEDEPDARFILLEDCKHCIESNALMYFMTLSNDAVQMKTCPKCKTPIRKCMRFMNQIKNDLSFVIKVKEKEFGEQKDLRKQQEERLESLGNMIKDQNIEEFPQLKTLLHNLWSQVILVGDNKKRQNLNKQEIESCKILLDLIRQIIDVLNSITKGFVTSYELVENQVDMLVKSFPNKLQISDQELQDIQLELQRLRFMGQLCKLDATRINDGIARSNEEEYQFIVSKLLSVERFIPKIESEVRRKMCQLSDFKKNLMIERQMIVRAMGFKKGHWYKCPNGHIYAIGECGGAMQQSKCNECGAPIGGGSHRLTQGNSLASEMDGATESAWPGAPINYGNFY